MLGELPAVRTLGDGGSGWPGIEGHRSSIMARFCPEPATAATRPVGQVAAVKDADVCAQYAPEEPTTALPVLSRIVRSWMRDQLST